MSDERRVARVLWLIGVAWTTGLWGSGCTEPRGPEAAFDRLRVAVAARDAHLLYGALDRESRWAVQSVWDYHRKIAKLVESRYPPEARERELRRVEAAVRAGSPEQLFADRVTSRGDPFERLGGSAEGLGDWRSAEGRVVVTTTGLRIPMAVGRDGGWGYGAYREELTRWRDTAATDLKRMMAETVSSGP